MATITTNNKPRELYYAHELSEREYSKLRKEFSYLDDEDFTSSAFFNYRGQPYSMCEFVHNTESYPGWDGIASETAWTAVIVKVVESCQSVIVGRVAT
jgi:hypothetical protein